MTFKITFITNGDLSANDVSGTERLAQITINDFSEQIRMPLENWTQSEYIQQWKDAVARFESGFKTSALVTEMYNPENPRFALMWWLLYLEENTVYIRNGFLPYEQISKPFDIKNMYECIEERIPKSEDNDVSSEWAISFDELKEWRDTLKS